MAKQFKTSIVISGDASGGIKAIQSTGKELQQLNQEIGEIEKPGKKAFDSLKAGALGFAGVLGSIGVGVGFAQAFDTLARFDKELATLRSVTRASAEDMERFSEQARVLGSSTVFGANQAAQAQKFLAQAGLEVNQVLAATPAVLNLAQAGMLDLGEAADLATDIMAQMGLQVSDLSRINDVLVATSQSATTDVRQLGEAFSYAGPVASSFGLSLEETAAALGIISSGGVKASRAGTGLLGVLRQLAVPSKEAEGALQRYGLTLGDVDVAANGFVPVVQRLAAANINATDAFKIFGSEAGAAAQILLKDRSAVAAMVNELGGVAGVAGDAAAMMSNNLADAAVGLASSFEGLVLKTGEDGLTGSLKGIIDISSGVVRVFAGLEDTLDSTFSADQVNTIQQVVTSIDLLTLAVGTRLVVALSSATAEKVASTVATIANSQAEATAAQAVTRRTGAELASAKAMLSSIRLEEQATRGTAAHKIALDALSAARIRATEAAGAHTVAVNASTAAMGKASVAARGLTGAMALVGGPAGAAIIAAGSLYIFREELGLVPEKAGLTVDELEKLRGELDDMSEAALNNKLSHLTADLNEATLAAASARQELANLKADQNGSGYLGFGGGEVGSEVRGLQAVAEAQSRIKEIEQEISETRKELGGRNLKPLSEWLFDTSDVDAGGISQLSDVVKGLTAEQKKAAREAKRLADAQHNLIDRLYPLEAAHRKFREDMELLDLKAAADETFNLAEAQQRLNTELSRDLTGGFMDQVRTGGVLDTDKLEETNSAARDLGMTFTSAFEDAVVGGKEFQDVLAGISEDIVRLSVRKGVTEPAVDAIAGFDWGSLAGTFFGGATGGAGSYGGGSVGNLYAGYADGGWTGPGGKYAPAGIVHAEEFVVRREAVKQPGVRTLLERLNSMPGYANGGFVGSRSNASASISPSVEINVHNNGNSQITRKESTRTDGSRQIDLYIDQRVDRKVRGMFSDGSMDSEMARNYGNRRRPL